jgi:hypothetical protein
VALKQSEDDPAHHPLEILKVCSKCNETKPESAFYNCRNSPDGLQYWCKTCMKAHNQNKEWTDQRKWRKNNPDKQKDAERAHYTFNYAQDKPKYVAARARRRAAENQALCEYRECKSIDRRTVWERDKGVCQLALLCEGAFVPFDAMHMDHIIRLADGGLHCYLNVQTSCAPCNRFKS